LAGDKVKIECAESTLYCLQRQVGPDGMLRLPGLEPVTVATLTYEEAAEKVAEELMEANILPAPNLRILGCPGQSKVVTVSGVVKNPGNQILREGMTLSEILTGSQPYDYADLEDVRVDTLESGIHHVDSVNNRFLVRTGDRIVVHARKSVAPIWVLGGVERPGEMPWTESLTASAAVMGAAGLNAEGTTTGWVCLRHGQKLLLNDPSAQISFGIQPGDILVVPSKNPQAVAVIGQVTTPARTAWHTGLRLKEALAGASEISEGVGDGLIEIWSTTDKLGLKLTVEFHGRKPKKNPIFELGDVVIVKQPHHLN
jgi:protein involved in polysaccharide export with SLBB domain